VACWAVLAAPALFLGGETALVCSAAALIVCLVPALLTLGMTWGARTQSPIVGLSVALGGSGIRMAAALGASAALFFLVPYFHQPQLFVWVAVFYLLTLALEVRILLVGPGRVQAQESQSLVR
jgi:hypothetical protein